MKNKKYKQNKIHTICIFGTSCVITSDFNLLKMKGPRMDFIRAINSLSSAFNSFFRSTSPVSNRSGIINSKIDQSSCNRKPLTEQSKIKRTDEH